MRTKAKPETKGPKSDGMCRRAARRGSEKLGGMVRAEKAWGRLMPVAKMETRSPARTAEPPRSTKARFSRVAGM